MYCASKFGQVGFTRALDGELREHMARMERLVGQEFGAPVNPLLVSVRSGAPISMPGMRYVSPQPIWPSESVSLT